MLTWTLPRPDRAHQREHRVRMLRVARGGVSSGRLVWVFTALLSWFVALPAGAANHPPAGHWTGAIEIPGTPLEIDVDLTTKDDVWTGDITIPQQGAKDLPLRDIVIEGTTVRFAISDIPGEPTFRGTLAVDGARISGDFTQGGQSFPFSLTSAPSPDAAAGAALDGFDAVIDKALLDFKVPGIAIAIISGGKPILMKGYGFRDVDGKLPVTEKTLFAIGSSTKAFTAFLLGTLVDEGKLDWDKPVIDYIPDFRLKDKGMELRITPRDLVTHRSGLPRHDLVWYNNTELTRKQIVDRLQYLEPNKDLRQTWQYNNLAFLTAGYLAEVLSGSSWEEGIRARIFVPLGMTASNFSVEESQKTADYALGYREDHDVIKRMPFRSTTNMGPAGSINSNLEDMSRWVELQLAHGKHDGRSLIQDATLAELQAPQMVIAAPPDPAHPETPQISYAMGWFVQPYRGHYRLEHGGNIDGFSAFVAFLPQDDLGLVFLTNKDSTGLPQFLEKTAIDRILGLPAKDWLGDALERRVKGQEAQNDAEKKMDQVQVKGTKPSHPLSDYVGQFSHPGYGVVKVEPDGKGLAVIFNHIRNPIEHWHYDVFNCSKGAPDPTFEDTKIQFTSDLSGQIDGLRVSMEPMVDDIVFERMPDERLFEPAFLAHLAGAYTLVDETVRVEVKGNTLILVVQGQPVYDLVPDRGTDFKLKGISGYTIRFVLGPDEMVQEVRFLQPNGVFTAKPVKR